MLTTIQLSVLKSYFGPEGAFSQTILEDKSISAATKIIFLQRALSESLHQFLASLDKLYNSDVASSLQQAHLDVIRSFKLINDLMFNHEILYGQFGIKHARDHFFNMLGPLDDGAFKKHLIKMVKRLKSQIAKEDDLLSLRDELRFRVKQELDTPPNIDWRKELDLPRAQQIIPKRKCPSFCITLLDALVSFCMHMSPLLFYNNRFRELDDNDVDEVELDAFDYQQNALNH